MVLPVLSDDTLKVAVMNQQAVVEQSKAGKRALEELKAYSMTRQKIINADDQELKDLQLAIQDVEVDRQREARETRSVPGQVGGLSTPPGRLQSRDSAEAA